MNNRLISLFTDLVRIDSPTGEEGAITSYILDFVRANKLVDIAKTDKFGNIYLRRNGKGPGAFYAAHLDTVEPGRGISPQVSRYLITSDGTTILGADNKAAVAAILDALLVLKDKRPAKELEIILTISEEVGNLGALNFNYRLLRSKNGYCFDSSLPFGTIVTASPYYERFDLQIIGHEVHASRPAEGINALNILANILKVQRLGFINDETIFNIGVINGGYVRNTVLGKIEIKGEIRSFSEDKLNKSRESFLKTLTKVESIHHSKMVVNFVRENPGYVLEPGKNEIFLKRLNNALKELDASPQLSTTWGVSDANIFNDKGLNCICVADGREFAHTTRERMRITDLIKLRDLMVALAL